MDAYAVILGMALVTYATRVAAIPAAAVAWRTRQVFPTILAGMGSYWLLRWMAG